MALSGNLKLQTVICIGPPLLRTALILSGKISMSSRSRTRCSLASMALTWLKVRLWYLSTVGSVLPSTSARAAAVCWLSCSNAARRLLFEVVS